MMEALGKEYLWGGDVEPWRQWWITMDAFWKDRDPSAFVFVFVFVFVVVFVFVFALVLVKRWSGAVRGVWPYFSCGGCFWEAPPGPEAGMGPGWKAWLGEVDADRARCGEAWADWDGEPAADRGPPANKLSIYVQNDHIYALPSKANVSMLMLASWHYCLFKLGDLQYSHPPLSQLRMVILGGHI